MPESLINYQLVSQIILPACQNGVDWGVKPKLIVQRGDRLVIWVPGQIAWSGRGHTDDYESSLQLWRPGFVLEKIHEADRFSVKLLVQHQ